MTRQSKFGYLASVACLVSAPCVAQTAPQTPPQTQSATNATQTEAISSAPTQSSSREGPTVTTNAGAGDDVVVTARRRDERLQDVPVSITAFSEESLARSTVQTLSDIRTVAPGLNFSSEGGKGNTSISLRGIGQIPLGEGTPGVVTYVNDVPIPVNGSNVPTYDLSGVQVLKGPQGTLFGRNTLGGAVLLGTNAPTFNVGGYLQGTYGNYDYREVQGALNLPLVADKVAIRFAGQVRRQDGSIRNLNGGRAFNNIHEDGARISLLLTPFDGLKSTTVAEYFRGNDNPGSYLLRQNFSFSALFVPQLGPVAGSLFGSSLDAQIQAQLRGRTFFSAYTDGQPQVSYRKSKSITNDTSYNFGDLTVRNIFGYRRNEFLQSLNTGANAPLFLPTALLGAPANTPFILFDASQQTQREYLTEEFQLLGNFRSMNFIIGGFYSKDNPTGPGGSTFNAFSTPATAPARVTSHVRNRDYSVYAQVGYNITSKLKLNLGGRYSWDDVDTCGGAFAQGYVDDATCRVQANRNLIDGVGIVKNSGSAPSYTVGLDYKPTSDLLVYVVSRRGFRAVGVNTPLFESQYTTGGTGCLAGRCPDLRPYQKTKQEKINDIEVGEKFQTTISGARFRFNTAVFYSKYKNALQFLNVSALGIPNGTADTPTNQSIGVNVANLSNYGVEVEASVSPSRNFTASFNGAYTHQKIDDVVVPAGLSVPFSKDLITLPAPSFSGTASVSWILPFRPLGSNLALNADLFMTADFGGQYGENLPGYKLANARLDWQNIARSGIDLGVFVKNITQEHYFAAPVVLVQSLPVSSVLVGDPRTYGVTARFRF